MKIAYVTNVRMPTEKAHGIQIAKACEAFANNGHEVELIVPTRRTPIKESAFAYYGLKENFRIRKVFTLDTVKWGRAGFLVETFSFALSAAACVKKDELIYGRDELVLAILMFFGAKRVIWESHDGAWGSVAAYVAKRSRALIVVTEGAKKFYIDKGVTADKIFAISNGVDLAAFANSQTKEDARTRLGLPHDKKIALYIGRVDGWKGTDTLLEASKLLPESVQVAVIGGEDKQVALLRTKYPRVTFLGYRPYRELASNQAAADVLVVPNTAKDRTSTLFTSPLKLLAHLAAKRPVVASDLPSIREIGGEAVLYVLPDDPKALSEGILEALGDKGAGLVKEAQIRVFRYDWGNRAATILSFLTPRI